MNVRFLHSTLEIAYLKHGHVKVCTWWTVLGMRNNDAIFILLTVMDLKKSCPMITSSHFLGMYNQDSICVSISTICTANTPFECSDHGTSSDFLLYRTASL